MAFGDDHILAHHPGVEAVHTIRSVEIIDLHYITTGNGLKIRFVVNFDRNSVRSSPPAHGIGCVEVEVMLGSGTVNISGFWLPIGEPPSS